MLQSFHAELHLIGAKCYSLELWSKLSQLNCSLFDWVGGNSSPTQKVLCIMAMPFISHHTTQELRDLNCIVLPEMEDFNRKWIKCLPDPFKDQMFMWARLYAGLWEMHPPLFQKGVFPGGRMYLNILRVPGKTAPSDSQKIGITISKKKLTEISL